MKTHELKHIEKCIDELRQNLADLANDNDFQEMLIIIHKPGFTTLAEAALVKGMIDSMHAYTQVMAGLKKRYLKESVQ